MKNWKTWQISLFVVICIALNYIGRQLADGYELPLWLDAFGTVLAAYAGGPVTGAVVGITGNLMNGVINHVSYIYALTSAVLGIVVGILAKRRAFEKLLGAMTAAAVSTGIAVLVSVPLNLYYYGGETGNLWGDGVFHFFAERNYPLFICSFLGELYVDFLDKLLTLVALFLFIRLTRLLFKRQAGTDREEADAEDPQESKVSARDVFENLMHAGVILFALTLASSAEVRAEDTVNYLDYVQTVYSSNNGLPCGEANDIAATNDGILWIGTYAGLYRYNGSEFRWMDGYESVKNVNCLYVDSEGRLWIGSNDNGLSILINEKIVNVIDQADGLPSNSVRSIVQGADGYYYIGTTSSMQILSLNGGLKRVNTLWEVYYADYIAADETGHVASVTSDGRLFLLSEGQILSSLQLDDGEVFNCCGFNEDGLLLAGTSSNRIYYYDISGDGFEEVKSISCSGVNSLNDLYFMDNGEIFVSADNGIGYLDRSGLFRTLNLNEFNNSIDNMLVDYQGNMWFTSSRLGLLRLSPSSFRDIYGGAGLESHVVNSVTKWVSRYYIGTDKGLDIVDGTLRRKVTNELTEALSEIRIRCIFTDSADHLWICTYGQGLWEVMTDGQIYYYNADNGGFGNRARLVTELSDGTILAAGDTGVSFIRDHEIIKTIGYQDGLINSMILTATEMADGRILAGTDGDGIAVIRDGEVEEMLTREDGLSSGVILRSVKDPKAEALFLVTSNGLCYMDEEGQIRILEHFPYYNNYDIWAKDEDTLFVTGSSGIYVVSRDELVADEEGMSFDLLDSRKGLAGALTANSWNFDDGEGNLFLSCDRGVFVLDTDRYSSEGRSYRMTISEVKMDGVTHRVESNNGIRVGRGISRIEVYPEVINYTIQDPYVGYYLEGFEDQWNILPQSDLTSISYTNLPTGEYTFHLAVFDSNKTRILEERSYLLNKDKEIYDQRYFRVYMIIVALLAVAWATWFFFSRHLTKVMERQQQALRAANERARMGDEAIIAIARTVDAKDERTSQHSERVSRYSVLIGRELGFSKEEQESLRKAARMHDIGKIGVPDNVLNKPGRLTDEEYAVMKSHTTQGGEILKGFTMLDHVQEGALYHHERYDGRGYPHGLKGEEIPLYARIIGTADAFDAMTANRVYRKQLDFDYVLSEMRKGRGTQFDPVMVDILLKLIDEGKIDLEELYPELKNQEGGAGTAKHRTEEEARREAEEEAKTAADQKKGGSV